MSLPILTLLDYIEKTIAKMGVAIQARNLRLTKVELEKLTVFSDCLKSMLPEEFTKTTFANFDRHMGYVGYYIEKKDFDWIESNFNDLDKNDFPYIKPKIYKFLEKAKLPERRVGPLSKNIFIVHGKDRKSVKELKLMLKELGLKPIVLHEQPSGSRTIVEKLEKYSKVGYAFVILTPDDVGCLKERYLNLYNVSLSERDESENERKEKAEFFFHNVPEMLINRARQNVILEFGFFMGILGRDRVCCLYNEGVVLPSDMHGIMYVPFKKSISEVRLMIIKELKEAGYEIKAKFK